MRTFTVLSIFLLIQLISAQYDNHPMTFQPIPVLLRFPDSSQTIPASQRIPNSVQTNSVSPRFPDSAQTNPTSNRYLDSLQMNPASQTIPNSADPRFSDSALASLRFQESAQTNSMNQEYPFVHSEKNENVAVAVSNLNGFQHYKPNLRRYDAPFEMPNKVPYVTEGASARYEERLDRVIPEYQESVRKGWQPSKSFEQRTKRPRYSRKDAVNVYRNRLNVNKIPSASEVRRNPKVVKYIADENGFAIREDLVKPLEDTIARSRQKPRILTASSPPMIAKVVSSAIRVSNHQPSTPGKFLPQIMDFKIGK